MNEIDKQSFLDLIDKVKTCNSKNICEVHTYNWIKCHEKEIIFSNGIDINNMKENTLIGKWFGVDLYYISSGFIPNCEYEFEIGDYKNE